MRPPSAADGPTCPGTAAADDVGSRAWAEQTDVKVFISWSGDLARGVAVALREWLPLLFDRVAPWASDSDIAAGQRGLAQIEAELADTRFGVVVVTAENQRAPWLNFEAGALSKTVVGDAEHRIVPLLVDLAGPADLTGPLAQFQAKAARRDGVRDLVRSLAGVAGIDEAVAGRRFDAYWPQLEAEIEAAKAAAPGGAEAEPERREEADVLDEILLHVRLLRSDLDGRPRRDPAPTQAQRREREFQKYMTDLSAEHGMEVFEIQGTPFGGREVVLSPKGTYTAAAETAVKEAFYQNARGGRPEREDQRRPVLRRSSRTGVLPRRALSESGSVRDRATRPTFATAEIPTRGSGVSARLSAPAAYRLVVSGGPQQGGFTSTGLGATSAKYGEVPRTGDPTRAGRPARRQGPEPGGARDASRRHQWRRGVPRGRSRATVSACASPR